MSGSIKLYWKFYDYMPLWDDSIYLSNAFKRDSWTKNPRTLVVSDSGNMWLKCPYNSQLSKCSSPWTLDLRFRDSDLELASARPWTQNSFILINIMLIKILATMMFINTILVIIITGMLENTMNWIYHYWKEWTAWEKCWEKNMWFALLYIKISHKATVKLEECDTSTRREV